VGGAHHGALPLNDVKKILAWTILSDIVIAVRESMQVCGIVMEAVCQRIVHVETVTYYRLAHLERGAGRFRYIECAAGRK
jgi:hypothetical protein